MHPVHQDIITLTVDRLNECEIVTPTRSRWTLNYYITQCTGNSISWRQEAVEKASTLQSGPLGPRMSSCSWRSDQLGIRRVGDKMWKRKPSPREAGPPVEQPRRTRKKRSYGQYSGGQYVAVLFGLQLPLTHDPFNKVRGIFF